MSKVEPSVGVILTVYKRNHYNHQLFSIMSQSILPKVIYIWQNESHVEVSLDQNLVNFAESKNVKIHHVHSKSKNTKFHGRFTLPLIMDTEYVAVFDDDTIPGKRWFENCIEKLHDYNAIVGANGRTITAPGGSTSVEIGYGDGAPVEETRIVDFVGHCWFIKREWIHHMWSFPPNTFDNGEDIHLAASCAIRAGIRCVIPRQSHEDMDFWGDTRTDLGFDEHATWRKPDHAPVRESVKEYWIKLGWNPLNSKREV